MAIVSQPLGKYGALLVYLVMLRKIIKTVEEIVHHEFALCQTPLVNFLQLMCYDQKICISERLCHGLC